MERYPKLGGFHFYKMTKVVQPFSINEFAEGWTNFYTHDSLTHSCSQLISFVAVSG